MEIEIQLIGMIMNFLGTILLLLFLDPVLTTKQLENGEKETKPKIMKKYLMKRQFAIFVIILGFLIQLGGALVK